MPIVASVLRFACDMTSRVNPMPNIGTDTTVTIWRGEPLEVQCSLFNGDPSVAGNFISDLSSIVSASLSLRRYGPNGVLLATKTVAAAAFDLTTSYVSWSGGTKQQIRFDFASAETAFALPSDGTLTVYGVVTVALNSGDTVTAGFFEGVTATDGSSTGGVPLPPLELYYTASQCNALFQPLDTDLTAIATQGTTSFGVGLLNKPDGASVLAYIGGTAFDGKYTSLSFTGGNLNSIPTRNFVDIQNKPTTLAGYGITDAVVTTDTRLSNARAANAIKTLTTIGISTLSDPLDQQILMYDAVLGQWRPATNPLGGAGGGGTGAGGAPTQLQYNNNANLGGVSFLTYDGNAVTQVAGSKYNLTDPTDTSKRAQLDLSNVSAATTRNVVIPDANTVTIQPKTAATHMWFSAVTAQGVLVDTQPTFLDISGAVQSTQVPAFSGDVTVATGTTTTTLVNIPAGVTMAGRLVATNIAIPALPTSGKIVLYGDSTSKNFCARNDVGVINHCVQSISSVASQWINAINDDGTLGRSRPTDADLAMSDITTNNVSVTQHGFAPKLPNDASKFLNGLGVFTTPPAAAPGANRPLFAGTSDKGVGNSTAEASLVPTSGYGSATLPAGFFQVGTTLRITAAGYCSSTTNPNLTLKVKVGPTASYSNNDFIAGTFTNAGWSMELFITCRTTGSSGTIFCQGVWGDFNGYNKVSLVTTSVLTVDTTSALTVDITATWNIGSTSISLTTTDFIIDTPAQSSPGSVWRTGSGAPSNSLGIDGDMYLDTSSGNVYTRVSGAYVLQMNLTGPTGAAGSVTSVGLSMPTIFSVTNSPVTTAGALTASLNAQSPNTFFCGPTTGAPAAPTFRTIAAADVPSLDWATKIVNKPTTLVGYGITDGANDTLVVHLAGNETITGSKTFTQLQTWPTVSANTHWCGPTTGAAAAPAFRALVTADLPAGIPNANLANSTITIQGTAVALGSSALATFSTPQFRRLGLNQVADANALLAGAASVDGITIIAFRRATDASPTGNFQSFIRADGASALWTVDITGTLTAGTIPAARVTGSVPAAANALITATTKSIDTAVDPTDGQSLVYSSTSGKWRPLLITGGGGTATALQTLTAKPISTTADPTDGQVLQYSSSTGKWGPAPVTGGGGGTVSLVGLAMPTVFTVSGSPVTSTGTLTAAFATGQTANRFLATPDATTGALSLRAIVAGDLPGTFSGFANPSALSGLTALNGSATTAMRSDAAPAINQAINPLWTGLHTFQITDSVTNTYTDIKVLDHASSSTPAAGFGASLLFNLQSSTTGSRNAARVGVTWTTATDASRTSAWIWMLVNNAGALTEVARLFASGGFSVNSTIDPGAGVVNAAAGFRIANAASSGNVLRGNGTSFVSSALFDSDVSFSDTTTGNSSTTAHGYLKKLNNTATTYMDGTGNWSTPAGGAGGTVTTTGTPASGNMAKFSGSTSITNAVAKTDYWDTTDFVAGAGHAHGLVPDPGAGGGTTRYLREDGTWFVPPGGGGGSPGGSTTQLQYNNAGAFAGIAGATTDGTITTFAAADLKLTDALITNEAIPSTPALGKTILYVDSTSKNLAARNDAGTVNHGIQTRSATASNWIRAIADDGSTTISQPAFTDVSGSVAAGQMPALTGDVTTSAGAVATTLTNIPTAVTMAGYLVATNIVAPAQPAAGLTRIYVDSTSKNLAAKNDANIVNHGIQTRTATASNWIRAIADDGSTTISQPAFSDISGTVSLTTQASGTLQAAQFPALTGDVTSSAGSLATTLANIPTATPMAGSLLATNIATPSNPAAGKTSLYVDSTSKNMACRNENGIVNHGVQTRTATASNWIRSIADDGSTTISQPAFTDISGAATAAQIPGTLTNIAETINTLTDGATINWDCSSGGFAKVTLGGNRTLANPTNTKNGALYVLEVIQDGTGTRTLTYGTNFVWSAGTAPTLTTTLNKRDFLTFICDNGKLYGIITPNFV